MPPADRPELGSELNSRPMDPGNQPPARSPSALPDPAPRSEQGLTATACEPREMAVERSGDMQVDNGDTPSSRAHHRPGRSGHYAASRRASRRLWLGTGVIAVAGLVAVSACGSSSPSTSSSAPPAGASGGATPA